MPYLELLALVPAMHTESLQDTFYCCGMAGIMGYKRDFHTASLHIGSWLIAKIKEINPGKLITDCLSCRLKFLLGYIASNRNYKRRLSARLTSHYSGYSSGLYCDPHLEIRSNLDL